MDTFLERDMVNNPDATDSDDVDIRAAEAEAEARVREAADQHGLETEPVGRRGDRFPKGSGSGPYSVDGFGEGSGAGPAT